MRDLGWSQKTLSSVGDWDVELQVHVDGGGTVRKGAKHGGDGFSSTADD